MNFLHRSFIDQILCYNIHMIKYILLLLLALSCGKSEQLRCYTKEEAKNYCVAKRIAETGESTFMANHFCAPKYTVDFCYSLGGI